jgi:ion channel-forming bestrophin family protein
MISYDPKDWFTFVFRFHQADTFRKLMPMILLMGCYTSLIAFAEIHYFKLDKTSSLSNLSIMHTLLGFALSMLLVFRTNTAYDRWWEARRMWGALNNSSRSLAVKLNALLANDATADRQFFASAIANIAFSLKNHLRSRFHPKEWENLPELNDEQAAKVKNLPVITTVHLTNRLVALRNQGLLTDEQLVFINPEVTAFNDIIGACERIKNTPIPFSYSVFLKKFIFIYVMTLPFALSFTLHWYAVIVVMLIFYALASLELIAEEIEDPFGTDANDLPTDQLSAGIRNLTKEILVK